MDAEKNAMFAIWFFRVNRAAIALTVFNERLMAWNDMGHVDDQEFMAAVQDMHEAGLLEFLDNGPLDQLRKVVTGVEL